MIHWSKVLFDTIRLSQMERREQEMRLKKVTIHKYKSFLTEQSYSVENHITRIVGKNESGKTALLEALAKSHYFEDNPDFKFNKDLDYPRSELIKVKNENPAVLSCEYELTDMDIDPIEKEFGPSIISKQTFECTSYYSWSSLAPCIVFDSGRKPYREKIRRSPLRPTNISQTMTVTGV